MDITIAPCPPQARDLLPDDGGIVPEQRRRWASSTTQCAIAHLFYVLCMAGHGIDLIY